MDLAQVSLGLIGGIGIFLYGMYIASEGLKKSASHHLKSFLQKVTKNQLYGAGAGIVLAAVLQSSSAATVMVVGFVNAGLMTLRQSLGVVLGSAIGTTITVQLIAFKVTDYALIFVSVGVLLFLIQSSPHIKAMGSIVLGFGFVFLGMGLMTEAMEPLLEHEAFIEWLVSMSDRPVMVVLIATIFTAIIQNSAAVIAIAMTLATSGAFELETAVAIVYGANAGTVATALVSSLAASREAQRTAVAHALFKMIGVLFFIPLTAVFVDGLSFLSDSIERQIAHAHTIFNLVNLLLLLPFCNFFARWMVKLLPDSKEVKHLKYLDESGISVPTVAIMNVQKELVHMAQLVHEKMFEPLLSLLDRNNRLKLQQAMRQEEQKVDVMYKGIYAYLKRITERDLTDTESRESLKMLYVNNDLEGISDALEQVASVTEKLDDGNEALSAKEKEAMEELYQEVLISYTIATRAFEQQDSVLAMEVINRNPLILRKEKSLRFHHFYNGASNSSRLSSVYVDMMNGLLRVNHHVVNISHTIIGMI